MHLIILVYVPLLMGCGAHTSYNIILAGVLRKKRVA